MLSPAPPLHPGERGKEMRYLFLFSVIVAALTYGAIRVEGETVEPTPTKGVATVETPNGNVYLHLGADGNAVILDGKLAQDQDRGSFSSYSTADRSKRLAELREINKPPPAPKGPETVVIVNQSTVVETRVDRVRHPRRQRYARPYEPTPLPGITGLGERRER
jgi:hypothetical protein